MSELTVGLTVFFRPSEAPAGEEMRATVQAVEGREVTLGVEKGDAQSLSVGDGIKIKYWDEEAIYYGSSQVLAAPQDNQVVVGQPGEAVSLQRRMRFRLKTELPFTFEILSAANSRLVSEEAHDSVTRDISAGGLAFESELKLQEEDQLLVNLPLGDVVVHALGRVVRTERIGASTGVSLELRQLTPEEQNHVLRFLEEHRGQEIGI